MLLLWALFLMTSSQPLRMICLYICSVLLRSFTRILYIENAFWQTSWSCSETLIDYACWRNLSVLERALIISYQSSMWIDRLKLIFIDHKALLNSLIWPLCIILVWHHTLVTCDIMICKNWFVLTCCQLIVEYWSCIVIVPSNVLW